MSYEQLFATLTLSRPFGASSVDQVGDLCESFIAGLGLPGSLRAAGVEPQQLSEFLTMVPEQWHPIVRACG